MKKTYILRLAFFYFLFAFSLLKAQKKNEGSYAFLKIGEGALIVAKGQVAALCEDDIFIASKNSSFLSSFSNTELSFAHMDWMGLARSEQAAAYLNFLPFNFAVVANSFTIPDIEIRTKPGDPIGKFDASYFMTGLSMGTLFFENFSLGSSIKYINEAFYTESEHNVALDFGANYRYDISKNLKMILAASANNVSLIENSRIPLGFFFSSALAYEYVDINTKFKFGAEVGKYNTEDKNRINLAMEVSYGEIVFINVGKYNFSDLYSFAYGIALKYKNFKVSYVFIPMLNNFNSSNSFGISYMFK